VPVDGLVVAGHSFIDQATITGESMPVEKIPGKIIEAVEQAEHSRAPVQRTADRLAGHLVYLALICAAFTFLITHNARSTISVVIVAGACGIAADKGRSCRASTVSSARRPPQPCCESPACW
jgi:cation transport ATPase